MNKINQMLNRNVAYATKTSKRGGYELRFANTNKLIIFKAHKLHLKKKNEIS